MPTVSVLMPVFNRERLVGEAIQSVIEQDFHDFELVIVDDGSTDQTPDVLRDWARRDPRIRIVTSPVNLGIPGALNLGLDATTAAFIARLDSDDLLLPRRLAEQAAVLEREPGVVLVSCAYEIVDDRGNDLGTWHTDEPHEVVRYLLNFTNIVGGGGQVMFRRADVMAEGGYSRRYPSSEDYDLWIRLLRRGRIHTLPFAGMRKRHHSANSLSRYGDVKRENWRGIMTGSLERYLGRLIGIEEVDALIAVWREQDAGGSGSLADAIMREAFARFCTEHRDSRLRQRVKARTARQWFITARRLFASGRRAEALEALARGTKWSPRTLLRSARNALISS